MKCLTFVLFSCMGSNLNANEGIIWTSWKNVKKSKMLIRSRWHLFSDGGNTDDYLDNI